MRVTHRMLLPLTALAAAIFSLFLPDLSAHMINRSVGPRQYTVQTVQLSAAKPIDITDALTLMSGKYKALDIMTGNLLSAEKAHQTVLEMAEYFMGYGIHLDMQLYTEHKETPVFAISEEGDNGSVIWKCLFTNVSGDKTIVFHLDDRTGKMLSFFYSSYGESNQSPHEDAAGLTVDTWAEMCVHYYGFQSVEVKMYSEEDSIRKYSLLFLDMNENYHTLPFTMIGRNSTVNQKTDSGIYRTVIGFNENSLAR